MELKKARERMNGYCQVCNRCDGRVCAGEVPGMGGVGSGSSFKNNIKALENIEFKMKVMAPVSMPATEIDLLGKKLAFPLLAAPVAGVPFNMSDEISEEEYIMAVLKGCRESKILGSCGDGAPDYVYQAGFKAIKAVDGNGIPFIKPWEDRELFKKLGEVEETGADIVGIDVDAIGLSTIDTMGKKVVTRSLEEWKKVIDKIPYKMILKGIMTPEEAELAIEVGADAIVVSNHGGRVLDYTPGTSEVLPDIVDRVKGRITVLADGGIRSGADVVKMLALGADAVLSGRPLAIAAMNDLENGVKNYLNKIQLEIKQTMLLTGCQTIAGIDRTILC